MLYFIHGTDAIKVSEKSTQLISGILVKKPDASVFKLNSENFQVAEFQELLVGQALFVQKYIVHISRILDEKEISEIILENLETMKNSEHIFIWTEGEVPLELLGQIKKVSEKVQEFNQRENLKKPVFNIFSLGDALGRRDKKNLWILYREALNFFAVEEIHGTLFWQMKSILISTKGSVAETGLKPSVYNKSKSFAKNYSEEELGRFSSELMIISHEARRGHHNFETALERFCLGI